MFLFTTAYLRWVKNIITTTNTSNIRVAKTPIVAMVPRFIFPSSPNVTQPFIEISERLCNSLSQLNKLNFK
jgi:hypothetical protein